MTRSGEPSDPRDNIINFLPQMRAFAISLTRNASAADDLVQDSIIKAWKSFHQFDVNTNLRAWLFTIVRNTFYSDIRKARREQTFGDVTTAETLNAAHESPAIIESIDFDKAFQKLPEDQREALVLTGALGMSYEEAAETCGVAVGTIKSRIARGRKRLATMLYGEGEENSTVSPQD